MQFFTTLGIMIFVGAVIGVLALLLEAVSSWAARKLDKTTPSTMWVNFHKDEQSGLEYVTAYSDEYMARKVARVQGKATTLRYVRG